MFGFYLKKWEKKKFAEDAWEIFSTFIWISLSYQQFLQEQIIKKRIFCCFSFIYVFSLFKLFWENLSSFLTFFYTKPISLYLATTHSHVWKIRMTFLWRWNNETKNVDIDILSTIRVCRISYCCSNKKSYVSFRPI